MSEIHKNMSSKNLNAANSIENSSIFSLPLKIYNAGFFDFFTVSLESDMRVKFRNLQLISNSYLGFWHVWRNYDDRLNPKLQLFQLKTVKRFIYKLLIKKRLDDDVAACVLYEEFILRNWFSQWTCIIIESFNSLFGRILYVKILCLLGNHAL